MGAPDDDEPLSVDETRLTVTNGQLNGLVERLARHRRWISLTSLFDHLAMVVVTTPALTEAVITTTRALRELPERRRDRLTENASELLRTLRITAGECLLKRIPRPAMTENDRTSLVAVGHAFADAGDLYRAAIAFQDAADWVSAADCWGRLGELEDMEICLARDEDKRRAARQSVGASRDMEALVLAGQRRAALRLAESIPEGSGDLIAIHARRVDLGARLVRGRSVGVKLPDQTRVRFAACPALLGRDAQADIVLRDPGVSRQHARLEWIDGELCVADTGSRAGTFIGGARLERPFPLRGDVELRLGLTCSLGVRLAARGRVWLRGLSGLDRTLNAAVGMDSIPFDEVVPDATGVWMEFGPEGPRLHHAPEVPVRIAGHRTSTYVDLLHGDVIDIGDAALRFEIE